MNDKTRWVKDYVSTLEWEWFTDVPTAHFWEYCRLRANKEDEKWQGKDIKRGSFISSLSHMAVESGLSEKQIRLAISKLEKTGEITTERTNKYTLINIVKYADYQSVYAKEGKQKDKPQGKQKADEGQTEGNQRATILDIESIENIENKENTKESLDCSPEMAEALEAFEKMRKRIRKPLTEEAKPMILKKLSKMAMDEETQIAILNQSTMNSWQGLFPLQDTQKNVHNEKKGLEALMNL